MKRPLFIATLLLLILITEGTALATVNIETIRREKEVEGFSNSLSLKLGYIKGNTNIRNAETRLRSDYLSGKRHFFLAASHKRGEKDEERYLDKGFAHLRLINELSERLSGEIFLQKEYNEFTFLKDRELAGAGLRVALVQGEEKEDQNSSASIYLGIGVIWEQEVLDLSPDEETEIYRSTNYISCRLKVNDTTTMAATSYYQPDMDDSSDYRVLFDGTLAFKITKRLSFTFDVNYRFDNEPPAGVKKYDTEITNGISLNF